MCERFSLIMTVADTKSVLQNNLIRNCLCLNKTSALYGHPHSLALICIYESGFKKKKPVAAGNTP